jgi:hypothetical protein
MRKNIRLTERDLSRIVRRVINEDRERFTPSEFTSGQEDGTKGTFRIENGSLILEMDGDMMEYHITC